MSITEKAGTLLPHPQGANVPVEEGPDVSALLYSINCIELSAFHIEDLDLSHIPSDRERERLRNWLHEIYDKLIECLDRGQTILYRTLTPGDRPEEVNPLKPSDHA